MPPKQPLHWFGGKSPSFSSTDSRLHHGRSLVLTITMKTAEERLLSFRKLNVKPIAARCARDRPKLSTTSTVPRSSLFRRLG